MPNGISDDKTRIVYVEWKDVREKLEIIARERRMELADIMRDAAHQYVTRHGYLMGPGPVEKKPAQVPVKKPARKSQKAKK